MADRNTIFMLDDIDEDELGGFNDAPELPVDDSDQDTPGDDPGKEEPKQDDPPADDPDKKDDPPADPDKAKAPADTPPAPAQGPDINVAVAAIAKLTEQNNKLVEKLEQKAAPPAEELSAPEKPVFTQDQWDEDPQGCNEALYEYYDQRREYDTKVQEQDQQAADTQQATKLKAAHDDSWNLSVEIMPELADHPKARDAWTRIFNHPDTDYASDPNGPLKATRDLRKFMQEKGLSFDAPAAADTPPPQDDPPANDAPPAQDPADAARQGAEDEAARQTRVRRQAMHTGGRGGQQTIQLSPEQKAACKAMNVSEEAYAESLAALEGGK